VTARAGLAVAACGAGRRPGGAVTGAAIGRDTL